MTTTAISMDTRTGGAGLLRLALGLDAAATGANGGAYQLAADPLGELLGRSPGLLRGTGAFLLAFAAAVRVTGSRPGVPRRAVAAVIALNAVWALDSTAAAVAGWGSPTTAGTVWIAFQAVGVAGFAALQVAGLRRAGRR